MAKGKLIAKYKLVAARAVCEPGWRVFWWLTDEQEIGAALGDSRLDGTGTPPADAEEREHWVACKALRVADLNNGEDPFLFATEAEAKKAAAIAGSAIRRDEGASRLLDWEKKALAAGWIPPEQGKK